MLGIGLAQGLFTTAKRFLMKKVTQQYPEELPDLPGRSKGSFGFDVDACTSCGLCADACPNAVIRVEYFLGEKNKRRLLRYSMDLGYCLFCGLCVEACPKSAIFFKTDFDLACYRKDDAIFSWRGNVYPPPEPPAPAEPVSTAPAVAASAGEGE